MTSETKNLTLSALIITLGIVIPIAFHAIGMGSVFLPMYWPLAAGAFFLLPRWAVLTGVVTPALSFILTGMPPISPPVLPVMIAELTFFTFILSYVSHRYNRIAIIWILILGLIISKLILFIAAWLISPIIGLPPSLLSLTSVLHGLPGTAVILVFVPILVKRLLKRNIMVSNP
ncbi:MAG: ECF transporter S component [bacterium]